MTNPSVAPVRKLLAAVLGVIAVFVMLFGAGMTSWAIVALGAALLVLAIGLAMVNVARRGARAWVAGTAHVRGVGEPPAGVAFGRCELQLVVAAPGLPAAAVTVRDPRVPVSKWPDPGATLPVMVAIDDMRRVRIQWDDVMTHAEAAVAETTEEYPDPAHDLLVDEFLSESEAPPWVNRDRHRWSAADEDSGDRAGDRSGPAGDRGLAVREASAGPIVLEGTLVEQESPPRQRRRPSPRPRAGASATDTLPRTGTPIVVDPVPPSSDDRPPASPAGPVTDLPLANPPAPAPTDTATAATATAGTRDAAPTQALPDETAPDPARDEPSATEPATEPTSTTDHAAPGGAVARDDELDLDLEGDPSPANAAPPEQAAAGSGPAVPLFGPVITGIDEPPPPVTSGVNGVDLTKGVGVTKKDGAAAGEPAPADPDGEPTPADPELTAPWAAHAPVVPISPAPVTAAEVAEADENGTRLDDLITAYPSARPGPAGAIHGIGLTVLVDDLHRSRRFYRDVLGFHEIDAGDGSAVLASGDTRLVLRTGEAVGDAPRRPIHLNLEVGDLDAMHAELLGKGVTFSHGPRVVNRGERLELWAAELDDPDGHNIAISQWRAVG